MSTEKINLFKPMVGELRRVVENTSCKIAWYGGKKALAFVNDYLQMFGKNVTYCLLDNVEDVEDVFDYNYDIPLVNKHISVDISLSDILRKYHVDNIKPIKVGFDNKDMLNDEVVYIISSVYSERAKSLLMDNGVSEECIWILPSVKECENIRAMYENDCVKGMRRMSLDEIHSVQSNILKRFRDFCDDNGLRYWLAGGTMLGAVRHKGFIPWDDDVDVYMPEPDYIKFMQLFRDDSDYELINYSKDKNYGFYFAKLTKKNTRICHGGYALHYIMGVYIDIFPLVGFPSDEDGIRKQWHNHHLLMAEWYWYQNMVDLVGEENMPIKRDEILQRLTNPEFDDSEMIGSVSVILQKEWNSPYKDFAETVEADFEGEKYKIPKGYDKHLSLRYGDYMTLPPVEKRAVHSFPMFIKEENPV